MYAVLLLRISFIRVLYDERARANTLLSLDQPTDLKNLLLAEVPDRLFAF